MSVDILYSLGDDALANLFDCIIPPFPGVLNPVQAQFRITGFTVPTTGVGEYEINYKTQRITKPNGLIEDPKEFSFDFRVDKFWLIYNGFKNWKNIVANTRSGLMSPDINIRVPITVIATDSAGVPTGGSWLFEGCWIKTLGDVAFDYTSGDPLTCTVTMGYLALNDIV